MNPLRLILILTLIATGGVLYAQDTVNINIQERIELKAKKLAKRMQRNLDLTNPQTKDVFKMYLES